MRFNDLLMMSIGNLKRRKIRTVLTVMGVVIGTASVVIMMSLGIGLDELTTKMYESYGSMTAITVNTSSGFMDNSDSKVEPMYITDEVIDSLSHLNHIDYVTPELSTNILMKQGVWQLNTMLIGVNSKFLNDIKISQGKLPDPNKHQLDLVIGNTVITSWTNAKTGKGYYDNNILPEVDYFNKPLFAIFDVDAYYQSQNPSDSETFVAAPKKYLLKTAATVAGGPEEWNQYSYNIYVDIDALKIQLKKVFKNNPIPGQPTNKKGKPYKYFVYDTATVYCDNMKNVTTVQKEITDMGYQASSNMEWLEQSKKQSAMIQAVLGGIGAVSLLVAAIGIANTMMMSIYERTKEIGIIKVLGCDMHNIRDMFLIESGFIGLIGGVSGVMISYAASYIINKLGGAQAITGMEGNISVIHPWLALSAIVFAVFVGMAAGLFPSLRAMKLSPLAAIRND